MEPEGFERLSLKPLDRKWKRGRILGVGGFSMVYLATREDDDLQFAVKSVALDPRDDYERKAFEALCNEIEFLQRLESKYIVKYLGHGISESTKFGNLQRRTLDIYMEYLPKGNLTSLVQWFWNNKRQTISEVWIATYTLDILRALDYLHRNEIVHGDIKGENVLFGSKCMKLVDFGSTNLDSRVSKLSLVLEGTKCYMAPEVESKVEATYASDIFSLGCIFLEMATGQPPYETLRDQEYAKPIPTNMSRDAQEFLKCCLKTDPNLRSTASQLLNHVFMLDNIQLNNDPRPRLKNSSIEFPYDCKYLDLRPSEDKCYRVQFLDTFRYSGPYSGSAPVVAESGSQNAASPAKVIEREEKHGIVVKLDLARANIGLDLQDQEEISKLLSEDSQNGGKFNICCCCKGRATNVVEPKTSPQRQAR